MWYGVHAFERLHRIMGSAAISVAARRDARGVVECNVDTGLYGGRAQGGGKVAAFTAYGSYRNVLVRIRQFINGGTAPVTMDESLAILAMLTAGERSIASGREEPTAFERSAVA